MKLGAEVGLGPAHIVLNGDPEPPPPKRRSPNFRPMAHICCGQTIAHLSYCWALVFNPVNRMTVVF